MIESFSLPELKAAADGTGDRAVLKRLDQVCAGLGAFGLADLGIPDGLLERVHAATLDFFSLPRAVKERYQSASGDQYLGWKGLADNRNGFGFADYKEMYHIGPRVDPTLHGPDARGVLPALVPVSEVTCPLWPAELPELTASWHEYYRAMQQVGSELGLAMAAALGVDRDGWLSMVAGNFADLAANYYPPATGPAQVRNAAHKDLTMFTILFQDAGGGGLYMQSRDGAWTAGPASAAPFIVNVGELLAYLTGNRWWPVPHEVREADPAQADSNTTRISIPFFYRPNDAHSIVPFSQSDESEPIQVGDWVRNRKLARAAM
jgi:isopenicillin N synthase-like dioxygenase